MRQNKSFVLGITGGAGAGKSTVLSILKEEYGAYLIQADEVGHRLRRPGEENYRRMVKAYGDRILKEDGSIDPQAVARLVFADEAATRALSEMTHPPIREAIIQEIRQQQDKALIVLEAALLREGGLIPLCDEVWYIYAAEEVRARRMMQSRGYSRQRCEDLFKRQKTDAQFREEADHVIDNSASEAETADQIKKILKKTKAAVLKGEYE